MVMKQMSIMKQHRQHLKSGVPWQMGHMPQEDYAEAIQKTLSNFLTGIKE